MAESFLNAEDRIPSVITFNNVYHDWAQTEKLGALAARVAGEQSKRVALLGIGGLSGLTGDRMQELETAGVT